MREQMKATGYNVNKRKTKGKFLVTGVILVILATLFLGRGVQGVIASQMLEHQIQNNSEIPENLIELSERNPETRDFVLHYPENLGKSSKISLTGEVDQGTIPLFMQWDERWGYRTYGSDCMALTGCGPTCLSMVYCGLTGNTDWNPYKVAKKTQKDGYYVEGSGSSWNMMTGVAQELGLHSKVISPDADRILNNLEAGNPIICIMGPGNFTTSGHFIVLTGVDSQGQVQVNDPNSRKNSNRSWDVNELIPEIRNLWTYWI